MAPAGAPFICPVNLPDGARVTRLTADYERAINDSLQLSFVRYINQSSTNEMLAQIEPPQTGDTNVYTVNANTVVDNSLYSYYLALYLGPYGNANIFYNAKIEYSISIE